jgi:hypothetical protein
MRVLAAALLACLLSAGTAAARGREHHTDPKAYLTRANKLAGEGKCAEAIKDFTKAYEKLKDPVVLFNRAECYRRVGENARAAAHYRGFLAGFPTAPNRADIEAKIAALEKPAAPPPPRTPPPKPPVPPATATAPPPKAPAPPTTATAPPPPPRTPPPPATAPAKPPPAPPPVAEEMPLLPPPPGPAGETSGLVEAPRTPEAEKPKTEAKSSRWWLWTGLAVLAVGGGVAGYIYLRPKEEPLPDTTLGNFRF